MKIEEKIDKIFEMSKQIIMIKGISEEEVDKLFIETKLILETYKELTGDSNE